MNPFRGASTADVRALAATRMGVAAVLLYDLLTRLSDFRAHYTEGGVLPLADVPAEPLFGNGLLSLHLLAPSAWAQGLLFAAALLCALALLLGHHTQRATWASWWLLISLHARNPHVLYEADVMLGLLLLWGGLLPWGRAWGLDARRRPRPPLQVSSLAVLGIKLQMAGALLVAMLSKSGESWWDGTAVGRVLTLDVYTGSFGRWVGTLPGASSLLTWGTLALELLGPLLIFLRPPWRWLGLVALAALQLGFAGTLYLGIFPAVFFVALLPCVPTRVGRVVRDRRRWVAVAAGSLAVLSAVHNVAYLGGGYGDGALSRRVEWLVRTLHADQGWGMFAPDPMNEDVWCAIPARLADGREVDLLHGGELSLGKPAHVSASFGGDRWKELLMAAEEASEVDPTLFERLLQHFVARWDAEHPANPVRYARLIWIGELTRDDLSEAPLTREELALWRRPPPSLPRDQ